LSRKYQFFLFLNIAIVIAGSSQHLDFPFANIKDTTYIDCRDGQYYLYLNNNENKNIKALISIQDIRNPLPLKSYEKNLYLPLYYQIKKGDTNYRILKIYFARDSAEIKMVNKVQSDIIKEGNKLLIGYYPIHSAKHSAKIREDTNFLPIDKARKTLVIVSGPASTFAPPIEKIPYPFVLSNKIPEHTVIEVVNPMTKKKILGKVIGKIPPGKYPLDILLLLSKNEAKELGFMDAKFFISAKFYK
jgi:hypothetical protein